MLVLDIVERALLPKERNSLALLLAVIAAHADAVKGVTQENTEILVLVPKGLLKADHIEIFPEHLIC